MQSTLTADGTEQTVDSFDLDRGGVLHYFIDLSGMESGDEVRLREYVDVNGDGTYSLHAQTVFNDSQPEPVISQSNRLMTTSGVPVRVALEQTATGANGYKDFDYATGVQH